MKQNLRFILILAAGVSVAAQNGADLLQQALRKEAVEGDLPAAIELYRRIASGPESGRPAAARALIQMGKAYEKLGAVEARTAYEKVVSEYADQAAEAAEAKRRLETLGGPALPDTGRARLVIQKITPEGSEDWDHWVSFGDTRPSPDGRYFGYVNWSHGNLAVCDARTGQVRDLTTEGTWSGENQFTWGAVWSPQSDQIAFLWIQGGEGDLRVIDRAGGKPRVLVSREQGGSIAPFDWSRDGRYIIGLAPIKQRSAYSDKKLSIVRVEVATGSVSVVKDLPFPSDNVQISLSPDGRHIAYDTKPRPRDANLGPRSQIRIVSIDGSNDRALIEHPAGHYSPYWTPDGGHLVFGSQRSGEDALWALAMKDGAPLGQPRLIRDSAGGSRLLGFADDGSLYFSASTPQMNIFVAETDFEAGTIQPPRLVSLRHDGKNRNVRWSADGSQLAYLSARTPAGALVFHEISTGRERDVEVPALNFFSPPLWSPDLTKLAGSAKVPGADGERRALYLIDAKSGQRSMLFERDSDWANYTKDGRHLVYLRHDWKGADSASELIERDLESGAERIIVRARENLGFGDRVLLSPDGAALAHCHQPYSPSEEHETKLWITSRAGGTMREIWRLASGRASVMDWLPDSRRVLVSVEDKQGAQQLCLIDIETRQERLLGPALRGQDRLQQVSVHPDGKRIAFSRGGVRKEIWTIKNIGAGEKRAGR